MANEVEGTWKNFTFKFIQKNDIKDVLLALQTSYYFEERISELMGFSQNYSDDLDNYYRDIFENDENLSLSFMALETTTNKIAGIQINVKKTRNKSLTVSNSRVYKSWNMKVLSKIVDQSNKEANVWDHYGTLLNSNQVLGKFDTSVTTPEFRNQGLAKEMYRRSIELFKSKGVLVAEGLFTSPFTRKIGQHFGFREMARVYLSSLDLQDTIENESCFPQNVNQDDYLSHMCIELK